MGGCACVVNIWVVLYNLRKLRIINTLWPNLDMLSFIKRPAEVFNISLVPKDIHFSFMEDQKLCSTINIFWILVLQTIFYWSQFFMSKSQNFDACSGCGYVDVCQKEKWPIGLCFLLLGHVVKFVACCDGVLRFYWRDPFFLLTGRYMGRCGLVSLTHGPLWVVWAFEADAWCNTGSKYFVLTCR